MHSRIKAVLRKDLFFVVGCQKSGTTWLKHLLDAHPEVVCRGEGRFSSVLLPLLRQMLGTYNRSHYAGHDLDFTDEQLEYLFVTCVGIFFSNAIGDRSVRCVGEKMPEHALLMPVLERLFPRERFVHIIRDPRDAITSNWLRPHSEDFAKQFPDLAGYVEHFMTHHWLNYIETARSIGQKEPHRYFEVRYEDLHAEPEPMARRLLAFLGVDDSAESATACVEGASFEKLSGGRRPGQEDRSSFFRKGVVGDWRMLFDDPCLDIVTRRGGEWVRSLGYA